MKCTDPETLDQSLLTGAEAGVDAIVASRGIRRRLVSGVHPCVAGCGFYTSKQKIPQKIPQRFRKDSATSLCQIQKIPQRFRKDSDARFKRFRKDSAKIPMPDSKDSAKIPQRFRCQFRKNMKRFRKDSDARSKRFRKDSAKDSAKIPQRFRKTSRKCSTSEKPELDNFPIQFEKS